jgi:hypothetical protein
VSHIDSHTTHLKVRTSCSSFFLFVGPLDHTLACSLHSASFGKIIMTYNLAFDLKKSLGIYRHVIFATEK